MELDLREWLLTDGLGSFGCATVCDGRTRTYHGWLIAALHPPIARTLLLSHIDASLVVAGKPIALSTHFWASGAIAPRGDRALAAFDVRPVPTWRWKGDRWQVQRRLMMPAPERLSEESRSRLFIEYRYQGDEATTLSLRPLIGDRNFHHQQQAEAGLKFAQTEGDRAVTFQAMRPNLPGTPWQLRWSGGTYRREGVWYWDYDLPEERRRGLGDRENLYCPGELTVTLQPGESVTLEARVLLPEASEAVEPLNEQTFNAAVRAEEARLHRIFAKSPQPSQNRDSWQLLLHQSDRFVAYRASTDSPTIIAGYPWFNDWGRDTLIALPGLAISTGRFDLAKGLLQTFGRYCRHGLIPNTFPDGEAEPIYNSIDAALWWIEALGLYLEASQDWDFLAEQYPTVWKIYKAYNSGTLYNICVDAKDGLIGWDAQGVAITWMDAVVDTHPITPRCGKPIEVNALWYSGLRWASQWARQLGGSTGDRAVRFDRQAEQVKVSLTQFWNKRSGYFYDLIDPDDRPDESIRCNAIVALSLAHCGFEDSQARQALQVARDRLLTPYGLRSLDPSDPAYIGNYIGDRLHRDRAYHQGTVWSWTIGAFVRAWERFYPNDPVPFNWQPLLNHLYQQGCIGSISEIFDGDAPHTPQGAIAQAWSVAEIIRCGLR